MLPLLWSKHELLLVLCWPANHHKKTQKGKCGRRRVNDFMSASAPRWNCQFGVCVCVSNWSLRTIARRTRHDTMEKFVQNRKKWPRASYCLVTIITIKLSWHISLSISSICLSISFTHRHTNRVLNWFVCTWLNIASNNCVVSIYSSVGIIRQWLAVWLLFAVTSLY